MVSGAVSRASSGGATVSGQFPIKHLREHVEDDRPRLGPLRARSGSRPPPPRSRARPTPRRCVHLGERLAGLDAVTALAPGRRRRPRGRPRPPSSRARRPGGAPRARRPSPRWPHVAPPPAPVRVGRRLPAAGRPGRDRRPGPAPSARSLARPRRSRAPPRRGGALRRGRCPRSESASRWAEAPSTSSTRSGGPSPASVSSASRISSAFPTAWPSGWSMSVSSQTTSRPASRPSSTIVAGELARAVERLHERAVPDLDVEDDRVRPAGDLLRHDRGGDQRDDVHRRGHVAKRVEALVRGHEVGRLADDGHADVPDLARGTRPGRARRGSRESTRACRASRPCGRARARSSWRRARRRPRRRGRARSRSCPPRPRSSACRPPCGRAERGRSSRRFAPSPP